MTKSGAITNITQTTSTPLKTTAVKDVGFIDISSAQAPRRTPIKTPDKDVSNTYSSHITKTALSKYPQHLNKTDKTVNSIATVISLRSEKSETKKKKKT